MPVNFSLTRKGDKSPASLQDIDRELCQNLDLPYSDDKWTYRWYDNVGLLLAMGKSFSEIIDICKEEYEKKASEYVLNWWRITAYLAEHYDADSWRSWR